MTTLEFAEDAVADGQRPPWREQLEAFAAGVAAAWAAWRVAFGVWEWISTTGAVMLLVGLWLWLGPGPALTVVGGLVLSLGIAGGRAAAAAAGAGVAGEGDGPAG